MKATTTKSALVKSIAEDWMANTRRRAAYRAFAKRLENRSHRRRIRAQMHVETLSEWVHPGFYIHTKDPEILFLRKLGLYDEQGLVRDYYTQEDDYYLMLGRFNSGDYEFAVENEDVVEDYYDGYSYLEWYDLTE